MSRASGQSDNLLSAIEEYGMLQRGDKVLIALSGGADSTALTVLLNDQQNELGISLHAAHLNHCLRGEESDSDENFVRQLCKSLGIQLTVKRINVAEAAAESRAGIEETARLIRYSFLEETAKEHRCTKIATAHNLNDNAETLILNLVRGSGLRGLAGIPPIRGNVIRPLIFSSREAIEEFLDKRGIKYVTDSTNADTKFTRNKVRHDIIPLLCDINPSFVDGVSELTKIVRSDADYLDDVASKVPFSRDPEPSILRKTLCELPEGIAGRVIKLMYAALFSLEDVYVPDLSYKHVAAVVELASGSSASGEVHLPSGVIAYCRYEELAMRKLDDASTTNITRCSTQESQSEIFVNVAPDGSSEIVTDAPTEIVTDASTVRIPLKLGLTSFGRWTIVSEFVQNIENSQRSNSQRSNSQRSSLQKLDVYSDKMTDIINVVYLRPELLEEGLWVRSHMTGDRISPEGRNWTKTLKKLYIDMKIPRHLRVRRPVIATREGVCAVPGYRADKKYAAKPSGRALKLTFRLST